MKKLFWPFRELIRVQLQNESSTNWAIKKDICESLEFNYILFLVYSKPAP